mgnify:CR=1 FL=1
MIPEVAALLFVLTFVQFVTHLLHMGLGRLPAATAIGSSSHSDDYREPGPSGLTGMAPSVMQLCTHRLEASRRAHRQAGGHLDSNYTTMGGWSPAILITLL